MASFNSSALFGSAVSVVTVDNPRTKQTNAYFGLSGVESLDGGQHGRFSTVTGTLFGASAADLNAAETLLRNYKDGAAYVLVDNFGNAWSDVMLESFEPQGRVRIAAGTGQYFRSYSARFEHLS